MGDRFFVGTRKGLFTVERGARGFAISRAAFVGDNVSMLLPDGRDGSLYAALDHGHFGVKLHHSSDGGESWEERAAPVYPEPPEGAAPELDAVRREPVEWKLKLIWSLEAGGASEPGRLWCGTCPGGLFRSDDSGRSWELVRSLWDHPSRREWFGGGLDHPAIHSIVVDPRDPRRVLVAVSCGGVWETTDAGESWQVRTAGMFAAYMPPERRDDPAIQDPHRMVACAAAPDALWVQHHNGVFRSQDGARSWRDIPKVPPSTFGFAVAVHPHEPDTAWFLPAIADEKRIPVDGKLVVARTRDGGASFEELRAGLPQEHAYDVVYRHCFDVDGTGRVLAFGSTTGSLFVSEDAGDSWSLLSAHLPPVYCVRFG